MTAFVTTAPGNEPVVSCYFSGDSVQELRKVLNRAVNTWEPQDWPEWLHRLVNTVDQQLELSEKP